MALSGEWGVTDANRRAKYYKLTARGRKHFAARLSLWERYTQAASMVFSATEAVGDEAASFGSTFSRDRVQQWAWTPG